jgi:hypothetical protein
LHEGDSCFDFLIDLLGCDVGRRNKVIDTFFRAEEGWTQHSVPRIHFSWLYPWEKIFLKMLKVM